MAWATPTNVPTGTVFTQAYSEVIRDDLLYLFDRSDNPARAVVYHNTTQSIANSTATAVVWNTETSDSASLHSTSVNTSRMTIPSGEGGTYLIVGYIDWAANATGVRQAYLRLSTGSLVLTNVIDNAVAGGGTTPQVVTAVYPLAAGEYVEVVASQTSGGALNINANSRMMIVRVA